MTLSDVFRDAEELHELWHEKMSDEERKRDCEQRIERLAPILGALSMCVRRCGQSVPAISADEEIALMLSMVLLIDRALERMTSGRSVS
jgi:hypothetical protein